MSSKPWPATGHIATALYFLKLTKLRQELQICTALNNFPLPFIHFFPASCSRVLLSKHLLGCARLRDGGGKSFSNKNCEKRARVGRGDRAAFFPPPPPPFPSRERLIFALLVLIRSHYTIWEPGTCWLVISSSKMIQDSVQRDEKIFRVHFPFPCCSRKLTRVFKTSWTNGFLLPFSFFFPATDSSWAA